MRRFLWTFLGVLIFVLSGVGTINLAIWVSDRDPPITYERWLALDEEVSQGGVIDIEYQVFRTRICPLITRRWLYDANGERHSIPSFTTGMQLLAGRETYRRSITIPSAAAPGSARYEVSIDYVCNPLQKIFGPIRVTSPPIEFHIAPAAAAIRSLKPSPSSLQRWRAFSELLPLPV